MISKISFQTRTCCTVDIPKDVNNIRDFIITKILEGDIDNFIDKWIDYEIENLDIDEEVV